MHYKPKMGFLEKIVTTAVLLPSLIFGGAACGPRYNLGHIRNPDRISQQVSNYQNKLKKVAETMELYDAAKNQYDAAKVRAKAEDQLKTGAIQGKAVYINLPNDKKELLAVRQSLNEVINENSAYMHKNLRSTDPRIKSDVEKRRKENEDLRKLRYSYEKAIKQYHGMRALNENNDPADRTKDFVVLETVVYKNREFSKWAELVERRRSLGLGKLGPKDEYDEIAEQHPDYVRNAHAVHKERVKNWWEKNWGWVAGLVGGGVYAAAHDGGVVITPGGDFGGENGDPGAR